MFEHIAWSVIIQNWDLGLIIYEQLIYGKGVFQFIKKDWIADKSRHKHLYCKKFLSSLQHFLKKLEMTTSVWE